jgi:hypothetical protein
VIGGTVLHAPETSLDPMASAQQAERTLAPRPERPSADLSGGADVSVLREEGCSHGEETSGNVPHEMTDEVPSYSVSLATRLTANSITDNAGPSANHHAKADINALGLTRPEQSEAGRLQDLWSSLTLDASATSDFMDDASGGEPLRRVLAEQDLLIQMVQSAKQSAERVRAAMDATEKEARRTKMALERLERLRMATAEVQDLLESAAATANIIGASRFSDDDEMRSFRDYLRHNPPDYPGQAIT